MTLPQLSNPDARRLFLYLHGLAEAPTGPARGADLAALIDRIGFVQVDSINTVERAHHMILFSRRQSYRPANLKPLLERDRHLFEHWTHDAAILPVHLFPHWQHRFTRDATRLRENWRRWFRDGYEAKFDEILTRIETHGPVTSSDVGEGESRGKGGWWDWHPSKTALEWLWRTGQLSITRRDGFQKVYDLTERVIPTAHLCPPPDPEQTIDWACSSALDQLGFATSGELAAYWHAATPEQARDWCRAGLGSGELIEIALECADGTPRRCFARPDVLTRAKHAPEAGNRVRILSPFDPALRDRNRAERLFGFHYRIEVFVPEPKRRYGYYVFPVMEGTSLIGRIDFKAHKTEGQLRIRAFWPEPGIVMNKGRRARLEAELGRMGSFTGCPTLIFAPDWMRETI